MILTRRTTLVLALSAALGGCKIVDNADLKAAKAKSADEFDAAGYVDRIWTSKVVPELQDRAIDLATLLQELSKDADAAARTHGNRQGDGSPWTYRIKGEGKIVSVDTESRRGLVTLEVQTGSGKRSLALQVGPVIFGTTVRDALPFIKFGDFVNQIQYAQVSRALNDRASKAVRQQFDFKDAVGRSVQFHAAAVVNAGDDTITATPVILTPSRGEKT